LPGEAGGADDAGRVAMVSPAASTPARDEQGGAGPRVGCPSHPTSAVHANATDYPQSADFETVQCKSIALYARCLNRTIRGPFSALAL